MAQNSFWTGSPSRFERIGKYTPGQTSNLDWLMQQGRAGLEKTPLDFDPIEQRALNLFEKKGIPSIMERLTAMGGNDVSSALGQSLGEARSDLGERLAAMRSNYNLQGRSQFMNMLGSGLQPRDEIGYFSGNQGFLGGLAGGVGEGFGKLLPIAGKAGLGYLAGGPAGAMAGLSPDLVDLFKKWLSSGGAQQMQQPGSITYNQ